MKTVRTPIVGFLVCLMILGACANPLAPNEQPGEKASLHLVFHTASARTLATDGTLLEGLIASYAVRLSRSGYPDMAATADSTGELTMENVASGTWKVVVQALNGAGDVVASGFDDSVEVTAGSTTPVTIILQYDQASGTGAVELTVFFPKSVGIDSAVASLKGGVTIVIPVIVEDAEADDSRILLADGTFPSDYGKIDIAKTGVKAGAPLLQLSLKSGGNELAVMNETVRVLRNLPTMACRTLKVGDFGAAPTAPKNVTATYLQDGSIVVSWTGTSVVADGYVVDRALSPAGPFTALPGTIAPDVRNCPDADVTAGTAYYYRVAAVNRFGTSEYAMGSVKLAGQSPVVLGELQPSSGEWVYWKDGTPRALDAWGSPFTVNGVAVTGDDVYIVGMRSVGYPVYWKNGAISQLPTPYDGFGEAYGIAVSGEDIYILGEEDYLAVYWKNGVMTELTSGNGINYRSTCAVLAGNDVYIGGTADNGDGGAYPVYWKNGALTEFDDDGYLGLVDSDIAGMAVAGNTLYLAGTITGGEQPQQPVFWRNDGMLRYANLGYATEGSINGVAALGSTIYFVGEIADGNGYKPAYWKNEGPPTPLPLDGGMDGYATGIAIRGDDVFISGHIIGYDGSESAVYWENGVVNRLESDGDARATGIAATPSIALTESSGVNQQVMATIDASSVVPEVVFAGISSTSMFTPGNSMTVSAICPDATEYRWYLDGQMIDLDESDTPLNSESITLIADDYNPGSYYMLTLVITVNGVMISGSTSFFVVVGPL